MTEIAEQANANAGTLMDDYRSVRQFTQQIINPLSPEDCMVQSMDDVSPTRWHIAHTTWFFETFVLKESPGYEVFDPKFNYLFNSYYNAIGKQFPRPQRGFISRPGLEQIKQYRAYVDEQMEQRFSKGDIDESVQRVIEVGLHHEQQHQELMLTDIKHVLSCNPTSPSYQEGTFDSGTGATAGWTAIEEGLYEIGHQSDGFSFDNESPRHRVFLHQAEIANQLVTCGEYLEFMKAGGYERPEYWLAMGWGTVNANGWDAPMYWVDLDGVWHQFTLNGLQPINMDWPVCHISYFEADAYARWSGARLPTEFEWETACNLVGKNDLANEPFADRLMSQGSTIHPTRSPGGMMGGVWQWTSSSYAAFPGYRPPAGAIGEYNGKFMINQMVLRGASTATSPGHSRATYRNFFHPYHRWQNTGIRLAK